MPLDQSLLAWNQPGAGPLVTPPEGLLNDDVDLAKALRAAVEAETGARDAEGALSEAQAAVEPAKAQDALGAAAALADGKPDPGRKGAERAERAVADLEHRARTLREVATSARAAFTAVLAKGAAERRERWAGEFDALADEALASLEKAVAALDRRAKMKALAGWQSQNGAKFVAAPIEVRHEVEAARARLIAVDRAARQARENEETDRLIEAKESEEARARWREKMANAKFAEKSLSFGVKTQLDDAESEEQPVASGVNA